jgi:hypothetical protein
VWRKDGKFNFSPSHMREREESNNNNTSSLHSSLSHCVLLLLEKEESSAGKEENYEIASLASSCLEFLSHDRAWCVLCENSERRRTRLKCRLIFWMNMEVEGKDMRQQTSRTKKNIWKSKTFWKNKLPRWFMFLWWQIFSKIKTPSSWGDFFKKKILVVFYVRIQIESKRD